MSANANTEAWQNWIRAEIRTNQKASGRVMEGAIADVIGEVQKALKSEITSEREARQKADVEISVLRQDLTSIRHELAELKGELKTRSALADMETRLARMETSPTPARLKTVS